MIQPEMWQLLITGAFLVAGAYAFRSIGAAERRCGGFEAKYEHMVAVNRDRTDELNKLHAELSRRDNYIAALETERANLRYFISSFTLNMKSMGLLCNLEEKRDQQ